MTCCKFFLYFLTSSKVVLTWNPNEPGATKSAAALFCGLRNLCTVKMKTWWDTEEDLREQEEHQDEGQKQQERSARAHDRRRRREQGPFPLGPVAQRRVAAGDADRVQPAGAELLVAGGGDEAGPGRGAGLPVMNSCKNNQDKLKTL